MTETIEQQKDYTRGYQVLVGDWLRANGKRPIDLTRLCGVSVNTAHRAKRNEPIKLDTVYKIYAGLREAGYDVRFSDLVTIE